MIEVSLLGPPRVECDGELVAFDTRKAVALLAHLALSDRPRSRDALADLLWSDTDAAHARGALRRTLSTLRAAVGPELIEATRDHVRLVKGHGIEVDVDRFRDLRGRRELERAVAAFRGDFLEGFAVRDAPDFEHWAQLEGDGLRRELVATLADLADARESAGDRTGALRVVQRSLSIDPLHEPAHRALIRLYASTGDRAAALVQYRECVRMLSRELGVPPLTETTQLYEAINRGSFIAPAPAVVASVAQAPQPHSPPFVGRGDDLGALRGVYDAVGTDGRVVLIEGEAGIGKTRLAEELVRLLRREGARVLFGRAYEDEAGLAYASVVEALRGSLREGGDWLAGAGDRVLSEAARLVPELGPGRGVDGVPALAGPGAETRFLSGVWDTMVAAADGDTPGVLLIDDAQWADDATLSLLTYGLRRLEGRPLLVILTWRTPHDHPLRRAVAAAARAGGGAVLRLDRLGERAVGALLRAARPGDEDPALTRRLWEKTEGVPLLLVEYLRSPVADGDWPLPRGARDLFQARLDPVSETGRQVLSAAAVLGRSFDVDTVRVVSGRTDEETVTALEEVVRRGLVGEGRFDYDFEHDLLRALVYEGTSLARRRLLHGRAAEVLGAPVAAVARHLQLAGRDGEAARAFREAGEQARSVFANAEALGHLHAALALGHPARTELLTAIGDLQTVMGDYAGALLSLETAAAGCGPAELSSVEHRLGRLQHRRGEYALAQMHLQAALSAAPDPGPAARAGITADLSLAAHCLGDASRAQLLAGQAEALAEEAGDPRARCQAHNLVGMLATASGDTDHALASLRRSRALAEQVGDHDLRVAALNNLALAHRARDEMKTAIELTVAALDLCSATGDRHHEAALHNNLADLWHATGRPDEAMAHLKTAVEIFTDIGAEGDPRPEIWKLVRW
ncbi:MAG: AAA family ATPase [Actinomycetota bacterium]|nr:AAA family ATPase [Actinomycetota bacterium]